MNLRLYRHFDPVILLVAVALVAYGALLIYSGSLSAYPQGLRDLDHPVVRQSIFALLGISVALVMTSLDYRPWGHVAPLLYMVGLGLLVVVLLAGEGSLGARRWLDVAGTPVQASEVAKVLLVIALARFLADRRDRIHHISTFLLSLALAALPTALILMQPDMGTAIIVMSVWLGMVIMAGARATHVIILLTTAVLAVPFLLLALSDYQLERLTLFLNPEEDPLGPGFNTLQAEISVGSGGLLGKGLFQGTQTQLEFLQTRTTDYIFSVLGEELGFLGAVILLALFATLLLRGVRVADMARDQFGRLIAVGIVVMILLQVFINIGVNLRLLPVTGIPLPFISQGGSSLITLFAAMGLLQSILLRHRKIEF